MAAGISDFNETENFEEYNPHPYQGGYDIALTYGKPLPPFSAICYPMSDASSYTPPPPKARLPPVPVEPPASPDVSGRAISTSVEREDDRPDADYDSSYGYSELGFASMDWWWNLSGFSPFTMNGLGSWRHDAEEMGYWRPLRRAADYFFGYSQGFGERIVGEDSYGISIYAYKFHGSDTVNAEIQPARTEKFEYHDDSLSSTYNNWEDENYRLDISAHPHLKHQSFDAKVDPFESMFSWKPTHHGLFDEQLYTERQWVPLSYGESINEANLNGNREIAFDKHYYMGAQNVQLEAVESSFQKLSYHEASQEFSYTDFNWEPSYSIHGDERNDFSDAYYERQDYLQPSDVELEPYKSTWAQYPGYYGISEEDLYDGSQPVSEYSEVYNESSSPRSAWTTSLFGERGNEGKFHNSEYAYQTHYEDHPFELEPFKPTWMLNPNYYGSYEDVSAPYKQDDGGSYGSVW